jgi:hypothetical protein
MIRRMDLGYTIIKMVGDMRVNGLMENNMEKEWYMNKVIVEKDNGEKVN